VVAPVDFVQGTLDVVVLQAVAHGPVHGYDVARFIHEHSDGTLRVLDGALYTALHRLEARGWIAAEWGLSEKGKRAKFYRLTTAGRRALKAEIASWAAYVHAIGKVLSAKPQG